MVYITHGIYNYNSNVSQAYISRDHCIGVWMGYFLYLMFGTKYPACNVKAGFSGHNVNMESVPLIPFPFPQEMVWGYLRKKNYARTCCVSNGALLCKSPFHIHVHLVENEVHMLKYSSTTREVQITTIGVNKCTTGFSLVKCAGNRSIL